jgi:hypothetical protein
LLTRILQIEIVRSIGHFLALVHNDGEPGANGGMYRGTREPGDANRFVLRRRSN